METLCDLTCFDSSSSNVYAKYGFEKAFNNEIMRTAKNWSYSGTLQIMALASVIGVPIETICPNQNNRLLPVYQNVFHPRQSFNPADSAVVRILWTNTSGWPDRSKEFVVNHFVPLFKWNNKGLGGQSTATTSTKTTAEELAEENVNPWRVVTKRRRPKGQTEKQKSQKQNNKKTKANDQNTDHKPKSSFGKAKVKANRQECHVSADTSIKHSSDYSENAKAGIEQSESKQTENKEKKQREKQSSTNSKVNSDDTSIKHSSDYSENAKAGIEQSESKQTESQENIPGKRLNMEEKKEQKANAIDSEDYFPSNAAIKFLKDRSALPFPGASRRFYAGENRKVKTNAKRTKQREQLPVIIENKKLIGMQRTRVDGSLDQNIETIRGELMFCKSNKRKAQLQAVIDVAEELKKSVL